MRKTCFCFGVVWSRLNLAPGGGQESENVEGIVIVIFLYQQQLLATLIATLTASVIEALTENVDTAGLGEENESEGGNEIWTATLTHRGQSRTCETKECSTISSRTRRFRSASAV
jgi:hypothetical protein